MSDDTMPTSPVRSFSGEHPFRPVCLRAVILTTAREWANREDEADDIAYYDERFADFTEEGLDQATTDGTMAAVVAVDAGHCPRCSGPFETMKYPAGSRVTACRCVPVCFRCGRAEGLLGRTDPFTWPHDAETIADERRDLDAYLAKCTLVMVRADQLVVDEDSGGWVEHGYDASADEAERKG